VCSLPAGIFFLLLGGCVSSPPAPPPKRCVFPPPPLGIIRFLRKKGLFKPTRPGGFLGALLCGPPLPIFLPGSLGGRFPNFPPPLCVPRFFPGGPLLFRSPFTPRGKRLSPPGPHKSLWREPGHSL